MASYLQDYLNDGEDWIIFAQVFHSDYNSVTYDVPSVEGYVNPSIPNTTLTVYEGDVVYLYFGAMDDSDFIETPHTGMTTTASLTLEGLDSSDISTINFGTEAEGVTLNGETLVVAIDDAYFVSSIGVRIQTGGDDYEVLTNSATDTSFILYNNGEDDGVQVLDISAILYNPEYDILEDQLQSVVSSGQITYIDHADVTKDDLPWNTARFDYGNGHDNRIRGTGDDDALDGRVGNDILKGLGGNDDLVGGAGRDTLYGGAGNDRLSGGMGKDTLDGGAHDDELYGGQHDDILKGGKGSDDLYGGSGDDRLLGEAGNDTLNGGAGDDILKGGAGLDKLYGGDGDDSLQGNGGNDWLYGGSGDDTLNGGAGTDRLYGGRGSDWLIAGDGDTAYTPNSLYGEGGRDRLLGGDGMDVLVGGTGRDRLRGGDGSDTFVFDGNSGQDRIYDFDFYGDFDTIAFTDGPSSWEDLTVMGDETAAIIAWDGGSVTLSGFARSMVSDYMFSFDYTLY